MRKIILALTVVAVASTGCCRWCRDDSSRYYTPAHK